MSRDPTPLDADDAAVVFKADGSVELHIPCQPDYEIVGEHVLAATECFMRTTDLRELAAAFRKRKAKAT